MQQLQPPICFGKSWEAKHPECAGGPDPAYTNPRDGGHKRDRCQWYTQCATRTTTSKLGNAASQVVKPVLQSPTVQAAAHGALQGVSQALQQVPVKLPVKTPYQVQQPMVAPQQMVPYGYGQAMVPPVSAVVPNMVPMNYTAPGVQMPAYLTVPEPIVDGQHWGTRFFYMLMRSMFKAGGHTIANFFDHTPFNPWHAPEVPVFHQQQPPPG